MLSAIGADLFDQRGIILQADQTVAVVHLREAGVRIDVTGIHPHKAAVGAAAANGNGGGDIVRLVLVHGIDLFAVHDSGLTAAAPVDDHIQVGQGAAAPDSHIASFALDQAKGVHRATGQNIDGTVVHHTAIAAVDVLIEVSAFLTAYRGVNYQRTVDGQRRVFCNGQSAI